jgi:hypothetical protein
VHHGRRATARVVLSLYIVRSMTQRGQRRNSSYATVRLSSFGVPRRVSDTGPLSGSLDLTVNSMDHRGTSSFPPHGAPHPNGISHPLLTAWLRAVSAVRSVEGPHDSETSCPPVSLGCGAHRRPAPTEGGL